MTILALTSELTPQNGWGRYSLNLIDALKANGVGSIVATKSDRLPSPFGFAIYLLAPWYAWRLKKYAEDCDVIHAFIESYAYIAYWLSKMTGKPYYITAHGTYAVLPYASVYKKFFHKRAMLGAKRIICISEYTKMRLAKYNLKNLAVINNGITFENFYRSEVAQKKELAMISVGMLKHRKGQHITLEAFAKVREIYPDAKYYIVGDDSDQEYTRLLKKLVGDLLLGDAVIFLNKIRDEELLELYRKASLFVMTPISYGDYFEGFGLVYLEANAAGLPVIGSFDSGAEDAIQDSKTGLLVPQEDVMATTEVILRILGEKELATKLSEQGISWAREHDWSVIVKEYCAVYENK